MRIPYAPNAVVKPIAVGEFAEALRAVCPTRPRLTAPSPSLSSSSSYLLRPRREPVSVACSGGVDSMALVYLLARLRQTQPDFPLGERSVLGTIHALIVDHQMRDDSSAEARHVARTIAERLGWGGYVRPLVLLVAWSQLLGRGGGGSSSSSSSTITTTTTTTPFSSPDALSALPNIEQLARTGRFRALAKACRWHGTARLFLAHHEDDDYETVLLRLAMGYTGAGLQGIQSAAPIPECDEMYGCSKSGLDDDAVLYGGRGGVAGSRIGLHALRLRALQELEERRGDDEEEEDECGDDADGVATVDTGPDYGVRAAEAHDEGRDSRARARPGSLPEIVVEDGGISVLRPLLHFSKDRLRATCEAARLPWVEDPSNADVALTPRNALRYVCRHHVLPVALQKPSVLGVARALKLKHGVVAAEARRTLVRCGAVKHFSPNTGIVLVEFPDIVHNVRPRRKSTATTAMRRARESAARRTQHRRLVTAAMVRSAMALVTPDAEHPTLSSLESVVPVILGETGGPPKALTHSHVLFTPVTPADAGPSPLRRVGVAGRTRWQLSRQLPLNKRVKAAAAAAGDGGRTDVPWRFFRIHNNTSPMSDDERLRPTVRAMVGGEGGVQAGVRVASETVSAEAWPERASELQSLDGALPLVVQTPDTPSLPPSCPPLSPADLPWYTHSLNQFQLWDNRYWIRVRTRLCGVFGIAPPALAHLSRFRAALPRPDDDRLARLLRMHAPAKTRLTIPALYVVWDRRWGGGWRREWADCCPGEGGGVTLVALPSLGVELPGLRTWLQCEVRYMKVDRRVVGAAMEGRGV